MSNEAMMRFFTKTVGAALVAEWVHGSSEWETFTSLDKWGFVNNGGLPLGYLKSETAKKNDPNRWGMIGYSGDQHMLTCAPTRSGKGTCSIVPALMEHQGGVLCIDPKGENAIITAEAREKLLGQNVHILDPWSLACDVLDRESAQFNPLDMLEPDSPDLVDDVAMIADALVVPSHSDSHWSEEAKSMISGFILYLVISPDEEGKRHLGRLRDILSLSATDFKELIVKMMNMDNKHVVHAGNKMSQKAPKELASVISTASSNTHFLESERLQKCLETTSFNFGDLKAPNNPITVFLVLPSERLNTHGRWLRLMVSMAITAIVKRKGKPKTPALFILDEFAALGKLAVVEQAYGLMAGFGMTIWAILQDLSQLQDLYDRRWQTFIANAGVLQAFGTRDTFTAEYLSKLCGQTTITDLVHVPLSQQPFFTPKKDDDLDDSLIHPSGSETAKHSRGRALLMPEEIIRLPQDQQLLFLPQRRPTMCLKVPYYENGRYYYSAADGENYTMFRVHPDYKGMALKLWYYDTETIERFRQRNEALKLRNRGFFKRLFDW